MARYCVGASMEIDWEADGSQARWSWPLVRRVFGYFRPYWRHGLGAVVCVAAGAALGLVPAVVTKGVIDALAHPSERFADLAWLILLGVAASLAAGLIGVAESWLNATISQRIMFDLREQLFDRLLGQSVGFFTRSRTGDVMSRIGNDVNAVEDVVSETILGISGMLLVKAFVTQRRERSRFGGLNAELRRLQLRQEMIGRWFHMLMDVLQTAAAARQARARAGTAGTTGRNRRADRRRAQRHVRRPGSSASRETGAVRPLAGR